MSVWKIEESVFDNCYMLNEIVVDKANPAYDSRDNCNAIIETETNKLITACNSTVIPDTVVEIADYAFTGCSNLKEINIPKSLTSLGNAFYNFPSLEKLTVEEGNPLYDSRDNCNALIYKRTNTLIVGCKNTIIPSSVRRIGDNAFYQCYELKEIDIPNSVISIGERAFMCCENLERVNIPDSVQEIKGAAFINCFKLKKVYLPDSVCSIDFEAFDNCHQLTEIRLPAQKAKIAPWALPRYGNLQTILVPKGMVEYYKEVLPEIYHPLIVEE